LVGHAEPARLGGFLAALITGRSRKIYGEISMGIFGELKLKNVKLIELDVPWLVVQ